jgi:hypothetical protein
MIWTCRICSNDDVSHQEAIDEKPMVPLAEATVMAIISIQLQRCQADARVGHRLCDGWLAGKIDG